MRARPLSRSRSSLPAVLLAVLLVGATGCSSVVTLGVDEPLAFERQPRTSRIVAPDGAVLATLHGVEDRDEVPLDDVAHELLAAIVAIEDRRFFLHRGIDLSAIGRAALRNVEAGEVDQGGSTITQQLVKTTMTGPARTVERKVEEALLALRLERTHDKERILEAYVNTVYFGRGAYGVAAAARRFFGTTPAELSLEQAALLAGVIASPGRFDPWDDPDAAARRRGLVLDAMVATGAIDVGEATTAAARPVEVVGPDERTDPGTTGAWVAAEVRRQLQRDPDGRFAASLGASVEERVELLFAGGLRIVTTVDLEAQAAAEQAVEARLPVDGPAAAIVALEPVTGAIRVLVGGRAEDAAVGFNLATQGRRSPGSAFKPLVLATALEHGMTLDTVYPGGACAVLEGIPVWEDEGACNYGDTDPGPLTLREATVRSTNTVYARVAAALGPEAMLATARQLGLTGPLPAVHSLALGSGSVVPLELATAYAAFANLGSQPEPYLIERIEDADGRVLYQHEQLRLRVLDEQVAWTVTDTLTDVVTRGTGIRAAIDRPQAGKTGTSQDNADAWFVGYTPDLVAAVWVGFPEGSVPLRPPNVDEVVEGGRWPAELWASVVQVALRDHPPRPFPQPDVALVEVEVDVSRNCLPNPYTPPDLVEPREYVRGTEPTHRCTEPSGPTLEDVPQLLGLPLEVATRLLRDRGYAWEVRPEHSRVFPPGVVTRQFPPAGGDLAVGELVVVWSSVASRTRIEPADVLGLPLEEAIATLEGQGFVVEVAHRCPCSGPPGTVHEQRPGGGVPTLQHDVVGLTAVPDEPPDADDPGAGAPSTSP